MTHYISVCVCAGVTQAKTAMRVPLTEAIQSFPLLANPDKLHNTLLFGGYLDVPWEYARTETTDTMKINVLFLDCDNDNGDPDILHKFREDMRDYTYLTWGTFSSTAERPKFRALIPLDRTLCYNKDTKQAVADIYRDYCDRRASWYFSPDTNHLNTLSLNKGKLFPADIIQNKADNIMRVRLALEYEYEHLHRMHSTAVSFRPDAWRNLPSVQHCLGGLLKGERDDSINKACYAMEKHGYKAQIYEFLAELDVPMEFKTKFRAKYK